MSHRSDIKLSRIVSVALACAVALGGSHGQAQVVRYELDSKAPLGADAWTFIESGATETYDATGLTLATTKGYAEWMLRAVDAPFVPTSGWLVSAKPGRGYWVEAKVRVDAASECFGGGPGLWIDDGKTFIRVLLETNKVHVIGTSQHDFERTTSDAFHVYRVQNLGGTHFQFLFDGEVLLDDPAFSTTENGKALMFGDQGACSATSTVWDYVAYDAFGSDSPAGDADADGREDATDNCPLLENADQADTDSDGVGNACDLCPADAMNDSDGDGLCGDQDLCPNDARNDQDNDGVCDTQECAPFTNVTTPGVQCPRICVCPPPFFDPIGGYGGGLDNFAGTLNGSGGNGGVGGGGGPAGSGGVGVAGMRSVGGDTSGGGAGGNRGGSDGGGAGTTGGSQGNDRAGAGANALDARASDATSDERGGCGCSVERSSRAARSAWALLVLAVLAVRRRRGPQQA